MTKKDVLFSLDEKTRKILAKYMEKRLASALIDYLVQTYEREAEDAFKGPLGLKK